jgi:DNA-binding MarR family transcriptional regulator
MSNKKYYPAIIAFQAALAEFRYVRFPILDELGMTPPCMTILSALYRHGEVSRMELAEVIGLNTNALGRPLDRLVNDKLVARRENPTNRRSIKLKLTKTGETIAKTYRQKMSKVWGRAFENISSDTIDSFTQTLTKMAEHLKKQRKK